MTPLWPLCAKWSLFYYHEVFRSSRGKKKTQRCKFTRMMRGKLGLEIPWVTMKLRTAEHFVEVHFSMCFKRMTKYGRIEVVVEIILDCPVKTQVQFSRMPSTLQQARKKNHCHSWTIVYAKLSQAAVDYSVWTCCCNLCAWSLDVVCYPVYCEIASE